MWETYLECGGEAIERRHRYGCLAQETAKAVSDRRRTPNNARRIQR